MNFSEWYGEGWDSVAATDARDSWSAAINECADVCKALKVKWFDISDKAGLPFGELLPDGDAAADEIEAEIRKRANR